MSQRNRQSRCAGLPRRGRSRRFVDLAIAVALLAALLLAFGGSGPIALSAREQGEVVLVAVGDVMLGRRVGNTLRERDPDWLFAGVRELLDADLTFANLESPLADPPPDASPSTNLAAGPAVSDLLARSGLRVVSVANNHALDAGSTGLATTLEQLRLGGVVAVGAGPTPQEAASPRIVAANGIRVAFLAFADVPTNVAPPATNGPCVAVLADVSPTSVSESSPPAQQTSALAPSEAPDAGHQSSLKSASCSAGARPARDSSLPHSSGETNPVPTGSGCEAHSAASGSRGHFCVAPTPSTDDATAPGSPGHITSALDSAIARARSQADVVVVAFHWGQEYSPWPIPRQRDLADRAVRAGAHLIVGSHPHVPQPVEYRDDGAVVAYSLGNFVFDQRFSQATTRGLALRATLTRRGLGAVEVVPLTLDGLRPEVAGTAGGPNTTLAYRWSSGDFQTRRVRVFYQAPAPEADLDGDGDLEAPVVSGGVLRVLRQRAGSAEEVWRSDPGWDVERAAVGDVDGDGRPEVVFALWRVYQGRYGNQPFVFGWRNGEMRPVWRGSAVADPIRELAVGDVDGDGLDELVVLEADPAESRDRPAIAVAVWRWSGWGFILQWRSPPGRYSGLRLVGPGEEGPSLEILVDGGPAGQSAGTRQSAPAMAQGDYDPRALSGL